jgi:hypothetical protein
MRSSGKTRTEMDIATICRPHGGSSSTHLAIRHTVGVLVGNILSGDEEVLSEMSSLTFEETMELGRGVSLELC